MSRRSMVIAWLISSVALPLLTTAFLGVFARISLMEHLVLFLGWLIIIAASWLLFQALRKLVCK